MARLHFFVEGQTEQTFADTVLSPHLEKFDVYMSPSVLIAHAFKKHRFHRGGGRNYSAMKKDIDRRLKEDKRPDVFFTTMIDLYAIPPEFPKLSESEALRHEPDRRVAFLEAAFEEDIGDRRFIPYIQLHEFEALLFVDVNLFARFFENPVEPEIARLQDLADKYNSPESINDGPETAPSKRIIQELPRYEKRKTTIGPQLAEMIGLAAIRAKCLHFNSWLTRLEGLSDNNRPLE